MLVSASYDDTLQVWEADEDDCSTRNQAGFLVLIECLQVQLNRSEGVSGTNIVFAGALEKRARFSQLPGSTRRCWRPRRCLSRQRNHYTHNLLLLVCPQCVVISQVLVSASYDDTLRVWEADEDDWTSVQTLDSHSSTVSPPHFYLYHFQAIFLHD